MAWASRTAGRGQTETLGTQLRTGGGGKDGICTVIQTLGLVGLGYIGDEQLFSYMGILGGGNSNMFYFHPYLGEDFQFD